MPENRWKPIAPLAALLFLAGCPEEIGQQCPPQTASVGQFTLAFAGQHDAGECIAVAVDGGDAGVGPLAFDDGGLSSATLCVGAAGDGGQQLSLIVAGKQGVRTSPLLDGGGFNFTGATNAGTNGTACICGVDISETFAGNLVSALPDDAGFAPPDDAGFALQPDGGLPPTAGLTATIKDTLTAVDAGDPTCICQMPCTVTYNVAGAR
jgi:hypothetical protein